MKTIKPVTAILFLALTLMIPAQARVSLAEIDQKLNDIIAALGNSEPVSVSVFLNVDDEGDNLFVDVYTVPTGKILVVEYVSLYLDVVVGNRPASGLRIRTTLDGPSPSGSGTTFEMGYMEEFPFTSRGTPNFIVNGEIRAYFGEGQVRCIARSQFGGVNLDFGIATCALSGRLIDVPTD